MDITESKETELALRESERSLRKANATLEAAAGNLEKAMAETELAIAGKSRFLAATSHDLRQPLQSISMYLSALSRQLKLPKQLEISDNMQKSLDTMGELLDALLDISKFDGGSITPEKRNVPLQALLNRVVTGNVQQANEKGLQLTCNSVECVVHTDPVLLGRVVENFITNAIHYTEQGEIRIDCVVHDDAVRINVSDSGIGISEDALERVFEEYYQLDNPARDRRKGLGLGLSIVRHIAQLLEHSVEASSIPGLGSTFTVTVPLGTTAPVGAETTTDTKITTQRERELVILIVDDDPNIVKAMTMLLESTGVMVYSAFNGDEALSHLEAGVWPDLVISDYWLPGYSGVEVIQRVRQATSEDLPSILMTGDTSVKEIEAANLQHCAVLLKSADSDSLLSLIESLTT